MQELETNLGPWTVLVFLLAVLAVAKLIRLLQKR